MSKDEDKLKTIPIHLLPSYGDTLRAIDNLTDKLEWLARELDAQLKSVKEGEGGQDGE